MNRWRVLKDSFLKVHQFFPRRSDWAFALAAGVVFLAGCGAPKPVLYPNDHLKRVGEARAQADIQECERLAEAYVQSEAGKDALKNTAAGAAGGAVIGGAAGAVTGSLRRGIGIGAAAGAAAGLVLSLIHI